MKCIEEIESSSVEEELTVSNSGGLVLLLEDLIVVNTKLKVGGTVPMRIKLFENYSYRRLQK